MADIFSVFLLKLEIFCQDRFKKLSLLTNWIFFLLTDEYIFGTNCLSRLKIAAMLKILRLNRMSSEEVLRKRILDGIFWELSDELFNRIWFVYRHYINSECILCKDFFCFKGSCEKILKKDEMP